MAAVDTALDADALPYYTFFDADTKLDWQHRVRGHHRKGTVATPASCRSTARAAANALDLRRHHPDTDARFALLAVRID